jgi:predicted signal transduction protein with EAL and GGDEF domain
MHLDKHTLCSSDKTVQTYTNQIQKAVTSFDTTLPERSRNNPTKLDPKIITVAKTLQTKSSRISCITHTEYESSLTKRENYFVRTDIQIWSNFESGRRLILLSIRNRLDNFHPLSKGT